MHCPENDQMVQTEPEKIVVGPEGNTITASVSAFTRAYNPGGKLNEDAYVVIGQDGRLSAAVFDGVSPLIPKYEDLADITGARFASHFVRDNFSNARRDNANLRDTFLVLNDQLGEKNKTLKEVDEARAGTLPSSTGTAVEIDPVTEMIEVAHLGDSFAIVEMQDGQTKILSLDTNLIFDEETFQQVKQWASEDNITFREATEAHKSELKAHFLESLNRKNNPPDVAPEDPAHGFGTGIFNGNPNAKNYLIHDQLPLAGVRSIFIGTDGIIPVDLSENRDADRRKIFDLLRGKGLAGLIEVGEQVAAKDPEFEDFPRTKNIDDATGIFIDLTNSSA